MIVEPMPPDGLVGNFNFRIESNESIEFFSTEFALETTTWVEAIKTGKRVQEEIERSGNEILFRNSDIFVGMYRRKMGDLINHRIEREAHQFLMMEGEEKLQVNDFIEKLEKAYKWLSGVSILLNPI